MNLSRWFHALFPVKSLRAAGLRRRRHFSSLEGISAAAEVLEVRALLSAPAIESINGTGNNLAHSAWGSAGTDLVRISPVAYADGISTPSLPNNPSARVVSDMLNNQASPTTPDSDLQTVDQNSLSDFGYVWGQFIDHDMSLTPTASGQFLTILADPNDPSQMGNQTFQRSSTDPTTGTSAGNPLQQINVVTSYLDLSQVYGSSAAIADALRTHSGGLLKTSPGNMLPYDNSTYFTPAQLAIIHMANDSGAVATQNLFVTGDVRGNENVELTALQTLFVRNHNQIAGQLQKSHPGWSDEQFYQEARKLNIAEYQQITYNAYLPDLLGQKALPAYAGYKSNVDAAIATEFSTVAFRFGHSLLSGDIERADNNGQDVPLNDPAGSSISLATDFFDPNVLNPKGVVDPLMGHISTDIDPILKADADGVSQADDLLAINDVRNLLFGTGGQTDNGLDLMARDVERARDDGIGSYNQVRVAYGLPAVTSFAQITSDVHVQQELKSVYGSVNNIDAFEGGLAENHAPGSDMGPLFTRILVDQFTRLRDGDRFFYLNESFNPEELKIIQQGNSLTKVIEANTHITNMQADAFLFRASISGTVTTSLPPAPGGSNSTVGHPSATRGNGGQTMPVTTGLAGIVVQLQNESGDVVATTVTDKTGHYVFNQLSGPAADSAADASGVSTVGEYTVVLELPAGFTQVSPTPAAIQITRGDVNVTGVNFQVTAPQSGMAPQRPSHASGNTDHRPAPSAGMAYSVQNVVYIALDGLDESKKNIIQRLHGRPITSNR